MRMVTRVLVVALGVGLAGMLVACEPIPDEPAAVRSADGGLEFVSCTEATVDRLLVEERQPGGPWIQIALVESVQVGPEEMLVVGPRTDMAEGAVFVQPKLSPGSRLNFSLSADENSGMSEFLIPDEGLPNHQWLQPDGTLSDRPCLSSG